MADEIRNVKKEEAGGEVLAYLPGFKNQSEYGDLLSGADAGSGKQADGWYCVYRDGPGETDEKASEHLQRLLYSSLQVQNLVVLAGLGTSIDAGFPSMQDLWEEVEKQGLLEVKTETGEVSTIFEKVNYTQAKSEKNIEELLSRCEAYLQLYDNKEVRSFYSGAKKVILEKCGKKNLNRKKLEAHEEFLYKLARRRSRNSRLKVFTTNYDPCFEMAASNRGFVAIDGFSFTQDCQYHPKFFDLDIVRRANNAEEVSYLEGVFYLYKLHGSVDWARRTSDEDQQGEQAGATEDQQKCEMIVKVEDPSPEEACLIYPARGKFQQSYTQPYLEMMSHYLAALREPNTCVLVVGFGFNDEHISAPLYSAVESNPNFSLIVVDIDAKGKCESNHSCRGFSYWKNFKKLAKELYGNVLLINAPFNLFVKIIPDLTPLTPAEQLVKDLRSVAR